MLTFRYSSVGLRLVSALLLCTAFPALLLGDGYTLDWWTVDGGGDMFGTGGGFELSGTIGQPDAGAAMTGGGFELVGGFWAGAALSPSIVVGDLNCDGTYGQGSFGDINPFVLYLSNFSAWQATYPVVTPETATSTATARTGRARSATSTRL